MLLETLRKYHPDVMLNRVCSKSYTIPGTEVRIERGTQVIIPVYALNHDPQYFPDPERFYPERFDPENKSSSDLLDFLPFGIGSRKCIDCIPTPFYDEVSAKSWILHARQHRTLLIVQVWQENKNEVTKWHVTPVRLYGIPESKTLPRR
uniref:Cytochrome P450 n=1 Tax=Timema bartmani TaxID=61472 RepID=A0A7R9HXN9_9NEOP|nr:unnamed protein product [Timema bartmani]